MMNQKHRMGKTKQFVTSPDVWLLSSPETNSKITDRNQSCKFHEGAKAIDDYIINNLSQIYIPITRGRVMMKMRKRKTEDLQSMLF